MRAPAWLLGGSLTLVTVLAGCGPAPTVGSSTGAAPGSSGSPTPTAQAARSKADQQTADKAVCALFTREEAQPVASDAVQLAPQPVPFEELNAGSVLGIGDASACEYLTMPPDSTGMPAEVAQSLHGFPAIYVAVDTRLVGWPYVQSNAKKEALSGLGDEAYYVPSQLEGDKSGGYLAARKGSRYLWISRDPLAGDAPTDIKQRLVTLAHSILSKI